MGSILVYGPFEVHGSNFMVHLVIEVPRACLLAETGWIRGLKLGAGEVVGGRSLVPENELNEA